jgi:argininosuccinate lyase
VRAGVPFREAHGAVSALVRRALDDGRSLSELSDDELAQQSDALDPQAFRALLDGQSWLESKGSHGGTALARVREQLAAAYEALAAQ